MISLVSKGFWVLVVRIKILLTIGCLSLLPGCGFFSNQKLQTLYYKESGTAQNNKMLIFLRGLGGNHKDFKKHGLVDSVREKGLDFDMAAPNAHFSYYYGRTLDTRLKQDIVEPARREGYSEFWYTGVSMGGLGALLYTRNYPEDVHTIILISPYLGGKKILREIREAGGVREWEPGEYTEEDWERLLWDWIKHYDQNRASMPPIYLGYGLDDPYVMGHKLLEEILPSDHVVTISGNHTVGVFKELWSRLLKTEAFKTQTWNTTEK